MRYAYYYFRQINQIEFAKSHNYRLFYSSRVGEVIPMTDSSQKIQSSLQTLSHPGGGTKIDTGISEMINMMGRGGRQGVDKVNRRGLLYSLVITN